MGPLKVRPKRLVRYGWKIEELPLLGVFTLDSPTRPNPIGLSLVRLLRIQEEKGLVVSGLDYFDGTPVLDIKSYQPQYRAEGYTFPGWYSRLRERAVKPRRRYSR